MGKINLDKYYTPPKIVDKCIQITREVLKDEKVSDIIEPSAGNGAFSLKLPKHLTTGYDIEPEHESIIKQDFLELDIPYKKNRLIIGNPPFGTRNTLSVKFFKKSIELGDFIAFILPISQYNNNQQMYEFNLIHSEELPIVEYSGVKIHCCFNIFKRNPNGYNKKPNYKLNDVFVGEYRRGGTYKIPEKFDFAMCTFGASIGKEVKELNTFCQENYIIINNDNIKEEVLRVMKTTDWKNLYPKTAQHKIQTWKIYKYLKEQIPELQ